jgi:DNA-binding transcriptional LysR family regulator
MALPFNLDLDVLRTFVTGLDLGSYAKAAGRLGRSQSAISLQLRKLEETTGQTLLRKQGRGLALHPRRIMLGHARRLLELTYGQWRRSSSPRSRARCGLACCGIWPRPG